ncbi:hypothetical protein V8E54_000944 [Elaphomyces granulatus]
MRTQCTVALPAAMTALVTPDRRIIILASSMKKIGGTLAPEEFYYGWETAAALLDGGRPPNSTQTRHRTGGCTGRMAPVLHEYERYQWNIILCSIERHMCSRQTHGRWGCGDAGEVVMANNITPINPPAQGTALPVEDSVVLNNLIPHAPLFAKILDNHYNTFTVTGNATASDHPFLPAAVPERLCSRRSQRGNKKQQNNLNYRLFRAEVVPYFARCGT